MEVELQGIPIEEKPVLRNLMQLCLYDYSEYNGGDVGEHGLFGYKYIDHYWTEEGRHPFYMLVGGKLAGVALVRQLERSSGRLEYELAEFFVLRKYRRKGVGADVAVRLFDKLPGKWSVGQEAGNEPAQVFWRKVVGGYTGGRFTESRDAEGPTLKFDSIPRRKGSG